MKDIKNGKGGISMWLLLLPNHVWFAGFTKQDCERLRKKYPQFNDEEIKIVQVKEDK